jgi:hypothetical protein
MAFLRLIHMSFVLIYIDLELYVSLEDSICPENEWTLTISGYGIFRIHSHVILNN